MQPLFMGVDIGDKLEQIGWRKVDLSDADDTEIRAYAAMQMINYHAMQPIADNWKSSWERIYKTASGIKNIRQIENSGKTRSFYVNSDKSGILHLVADENEGSKMRSCDLILEENSEISDLIIKTEDMQAPITPLPPVAFDMGTDQITTKGVLFDNQAITDVIGEDFPYIGVLTFYVQGK